MTRLRVPALVLAAVALLALVRGARADVITLASGDEIRGRIVSEAGGWLTIEVPGGEVRVARATVLSIVREKAGTYLVEKGDELLRLGAYDEAAKLFRQAADAGEPRAAIRLAAAERVAAEKLREAGDLDGAERRIAASRAAAARDPTHAAQAALDAEKLAQEVSAARGRAAALAAAGRRLLQQRRTAEALAALREAVAIDRSAEGASGSNLAEASCAEALRLAEKGDYARAAVLFEEALRRAPQRRTPQLASAISTCQLGVALERLRAGDPAAAIGALRAGLEVDPGSKPVRFFLGLALEMRGDPLAAAGEYRTLVGASITVPDGDGIGALRSAAGVAAGRLPVDPGVFIAAARGEGAPPSTAQVAAERGQIAVRAPDAETCAKVLDAASRAVDDIASWAGSDARDVAVVVTILPSRSEFVSLTGMPEAIGVTKANVVSADATRRVYSFAGAPDLYGSVIPHEMTHAVAFGRFAGAIPLWLNEGLAMSSEPASERVPRIDRFRAALAAGSSLSVQEVMRMRGYPERGDMGAFYDASAAITDWLIERHGRRRVLELAKRAASSGLDPAFSEALGLADVDAAAASFLATFPSKETR